MFTDMVGYTALGQRNESLSLVLVEEQRKIIRPILRRHNGHEIKTMGDAFLVEFPNALEAVRCSYDIQRALRELNISLSEDRKVHLRIGLHLGDVVESEGDVVGDAINVASRIVSLAKDGGVCLTRQVYDHVQNKFELRLTSIGNRQLKNVIAPVEVFNMTMPWDETALGFDKRKIAVLPFANISPDPNDEYFADGLTDELISTISKVGGLSVIARTSVIGYKGGQKKINEIAKELEVGTILEGTVRKAATKLRITAQLIDTQTSDHLWAESYDRELREVFEIQSEIAERVSQSLALRLLPSEKNRIESAPTVDVPAYESYLKGVYLLRKGRGDLLRAAVEHLEKAISLDSNFALAFAALGDAYVLVAGEIMPSKQAYGKATQLITRALELDENSSEAHMAKANLAMQHLDWQTAEGELRRSIELNPSNAAAHGQYSTLLSATGSYGKALDEAKRALELNPLSLGSRQMIPIEMIWHRDYIGAIPLMEALVQLEPDWADNHQILALLYFLVGRKDEAKKEIVTALPLRKETGTKAWAAYLLSIVGMDDEAHRLAAEVESERNTLYYPSYGIAVIHLGFGEEEQALDTLERGFDENPSSFLFNYRWPAFDPIRNEPRFVALVARLKLPN